MIAALALTASGRRVVLAGPPAASEDHRTTALMAPALELLEELGVAAELAREAAALRTMRIVDATERLLRAPVVTFRAAEIGEERFGLNIPNAHMIRVLSEAVSAQPLIDWRQASIDEWTLGDSSAAPRLDDGAVISAPLVIAADGRNSRAREAAGLRAHRTELPQSALVLNITHDRDHGGVSTEFHTATGPFTQVPLPGRRSSIVWVERPDAAERLRSLDDVTLADRIETRMSSMLGKVGVVGNRQVWRLAQGRPSRFAGLRVMLVGEAAHVIPPIGAQGLNLGIADVRAVVEVARAAVDPGSAEALARYDRLRRTDIVARTTAVSLLNHSLLSGLLPAQAARAAGLAALAAFAPLRTVFMREGLRPGSGLAALAGGLRKQVGR